MDFFTLATGVPLTAAAAPVTRGEEPSSTPPPRKRKRPQVESASQAEAPPPKYHAPLLTPVALVSHKKRSSYKLSPRSPRFIDAHQSTLAQHFSEVADGLARFATKIAVVDSTAPPFLAPMDADRALGLLREAKTRIHEFNNISGVPRLEPEALDVAERYVEVYRARNNEALMIQARSTLARDRVPDIIQRVTKYLYSLSGTVQAAHGSRSVESQREANARWLHRREQFSREQGYGSRYEQWIPCAPPSCGPVNEVITLINCKTKYRAAVLCDMFTLVWDLWVLYEPEKLKEMIAELTMVQLSKGHPEILGVYATEAAYREASFIAAEALGGRRVHDWVPLEKEL